MSRLLKVICVGTSSELLESRRLVLQSAGYETTCVNTSKASERLLSEVFDVMIVSMSVSEEDQASLRETAHPSTRIVQLNSFTSPQELLALLKA